MAPGRHAIGRCKFRIELDGLVEQAAAPPRLLRAASAVELRHAAQVIVVGVEAFGRLALGALDLRALQLRRDRADDACPPSGPAVRRCRRACLRSAPPRDARPVVASMSCPVMRTWFAGLAHAAFEHVAHAELAADLLHVNRPALVGEARIARDDEQPAHARQGGDDVVHHAVGEIVLLRIAAQVVERQDGDGGLVGKGRAQERRLPRSRKVSGVWRSRRSSDDADFADLADEAETLAGDRPDQALLLAAVADGLANRVDMAGQRRFRDDPAAPYRLAAGRPC